LARVFGENPNSRCAAVFSGLVSETSLVVNLPQKPGRHL
jgi:hypothetical protein